MKARSVSDTALTDNVQAFLRAPRRSNTMAMAPLPTLATGQLSLILSSQRPCWATSGAVPAAY